MNRVRTMILASLVLTLALGACGKKEQPKAPEGATYPRQYPAP